MKIFRAALRHFEIVKPLFHRYRQFYSPDVDAASSYAFIKQRLADNNSVIFIAEKNSKAIGFSQLYYSRSSINVRPEFVLNDLYIDEDFRNQGIATKLIDTCKYYSKDKNIYVINLETSTNNSKAKRLYEHIGFKKSEGFDTYTLNFLSEKVELENMHTNTEKSSWLPLWDKKFEKTNLKFTDNIVVITGITKGLGEAMLDQFVTKGFTVLGCGRDQEKLEILSRKYPKCEFTLVDISHSFGVKDWVQYLIEKYGVPKIVINNASLIDYPRRSFCEANIEHLQQVIQTNLLGTMQVSHAFLPSMRLYPNKTAIINISSGWGRQADVGLAGYCASKFGIEGLTSVIAQENIGFVTALTLDPSDGIATEMLAKCTSEEYYNSRPTPQEWAEIAVPYILSIKPEQSGKQLTVPNVTKKLVCKL